MHAEDIKKGIAAYKHEQEVLRRVLRKHGTLSSDAFDRIFDGFRRQVRPDGILVLHPRRRRVRAYAFTPETFILGGLLPSERAKWLDLLQMMVLLGDVLVSKTDGVIVYRLAS